MYITIIGGGKIGYYLSKTLLEHHHKVHLVEIEDATCNYIANNLDVPIYHGDGTSLEVLENAGVSKADILIAVTGKDEANLIACQLAKMRFGIKKTIARVNNPKNVAVVKQLGVDTVVSSVEIISNLIQQEVDIAGIRVLSSINRGKAAIIEVTIPQDSPVCGSRIRNIVFPENTIITSIIRGEEFIIPRGHTLLLGGDEIIAISSNESKNKLIQVFGL